MPGAVRLRLHQISKQFGPAVVLDDVDLQVTAGGIHGLIGQNGAGKSTLVKILAGLYPDHGGEVEVDGRPVELSSPRQSRSEGIAVIYQEFSLVSSMTVAENLLLGREEHRFAYSSRAGRRLAEEVIDRVAIDVGAPLDTRVGELSPAVMQRIEIAKALAQDTSVLVMDEPTARLSEGERASLFETMRDLADRGVGIMFISHFLEEVRAVTDELTVLRNGKVVTSGATAGFGVARMATLMLGEDLQHSMEAASHTSTADDAHPVTLEAREVSVGRRLTEVSVALRAGEILGVAGLVGSGRTRLARMMAGVDRPTEGVLLLRGRPVRFGGPRQAVAGGIAFIPEDRKHQGLSLDSPISENLVLMALQRRLGRRGWVSRRAVNRLARRLVADFDVSPARTDLPVSALSGGNQQKVLLAKAAAAEPDVLIIDQPTAGVDVGTKAQIHELLRRRADSKTATMVVSDDLDELYALSDRLCVMRRGRVLWQGAPAELPRAELLALMSATSADTTAEGSRP